MRVLLDKYQSIHRRLRWRANLSIVAGGVGVVFASFGALLGLLMIVMDDGGLWERRAGVVIGVFAGLFPLAGAIVLLWRGIVGRQRLTRLRDLAALARSAPAFGRIDVERALSLNALDAERLVLDAAALDLLEEGPPALTPAPAAGVSGVRPTLADGEPERAATPAPGGAVLAEGAVLNGTYRIEGRLGAGGMGIVYAASHLRTGRPCAVKTLLPDRPISPDAIRRFKREAMAAGALGHPGIIAVHDFDETDGGVHYLVMDRLAGETLDQRLARVGCLAWPEAQRVALEIASALAAAHEHGLLHRDLKPANIFLATSAAANDRAVLLDFGLAKPMSEAALSRITETGAAVGTPMYMSPEQARGEPLDARSDVYGLAAVVYEMVTGAPPFLDATLASVYARLLTESAPSASAAARYPLPPAVDDILACALAKSKDDRFESMRAFAAALGHAGAAQKIAG